MCEEGIVKNLHAHFATVDGLSSDEIRAECVVTFLSRQASKSEEENGSLEKGGWLSVRDSVAPYIEDPISTPPLPQLLHIIVSNLLSRHKIAAKEGSIKKRQGRGGRQKKWRLKPTNPVNERQGVEDEVGKDRRVASVMESEVSSLIKEISDKYERAHRIRQAVARCIRSEYRRGLNKGGLALHQNVEKWSQGQLPDWPLTPQLPAAKQLAEDESRKVEDKGHCGEKESDVSFDYCDLPFQDLLVHTVLSDPITIKYPIDQSRMAQFWRKYDDQIVRRGYELHPGIVEINERIVMMQKMSATSLLSGFGDEMREASSGSGGRPDRRERPVNSSEFHDDDDGGDDGDDDQSKSGRAPETYGTFEYGHGNTDNKSNNSIDNKSTNSNEAEELTVTVRMNQDIVNNVGLTMWPAGFAMAEFIQSHPDMFRGKRVLELGAGIGLTAIVMGRVSECRVVATDYHSSVLRNLNENVKINGVLADQFGGTGVSICRLDWLHPQWSRIARFQPDIAFACDSIYIPELHQALAQTWKTLLLGFDANGNPHNSDKERTNTDENGRHITCLSVQRIRNGETFAMFENALRQEGIALNEVSLDRARCIRGYDDEGLKMHRLSLL